MLTDLLTSPAALVPVVFVFANLYFTLPRNAKGSEERKIIGEALEENFIFDKLPYLNDLVSAFEKIVVKDAEVIIHEGDDADYFYVIGSGLVEFTIEGKNVGCRGEGDYFGDLALLRNCKRAATCVTVEDCVLWRLDQRTYRAVVARNRTRDRTAIVKMLKKVPLFSSLSEHAVLSKIATVMEERTYEKGDILLKNGDIGSEMHIIKSGKILLKDIEAKGRTYEDVELTTGDFFGERADLESEPRAATAVVMEKSTIYCISKDSFVKYIGSMDKLKRDATYFWLLVSSSKTVLILERLFPKLFRCVLTSLWL
jgi:cAMP-dependent protein kinase regulator